MTDSKHQNQADNETASWHFRDFLLSYQTGLQRAGKRLEIEPKALELLVYLVANHNRIIDRDEILEHVWNNEVIEEATISQTIYKLRKALGDEAKKPRFIATKHRRGYQFIAKLESQQDPGSTGWAHKVWILLFTMAVLLGIYLWINKSTPVGTPPRLALLPIQSHSENPQTELLAQMFDDLLYSRLAAQKELIVRSRPSTDSSLKSNTDLLSQARQLQVEWLLQGSFEAGLQDTRVWLRMELLHLVNDKLQSFPLSRMDLPIPDNETDYSQLIDVRNRIAQRVGEHIGTTILATAQTNSDPLNLEVLRLFHLATRELSKLQCGATTPVQYLNDAVKIDPEYTNAWIGLGYAYFNELWACGGDVSYLRKAHQMVNKALEIEPGNLLAIPLEVQLLASLGRANEALLRLQGILKENNSQPMLHFYTSVMLNYAGQLDLSKHHLDQALKLDPFILGTDISDPPLVLLYQQQWQAFLDAQPAIESSYHRFYRGYALWRSGDIKAARTTLEPLLEKNWKQDPFATYGQALLDIFNNENQLASEKITYMHNRRHTNGIKDGEMTFKEAWLMALAQQPELSMDFLEMSMEEGFSCLQCISNSPFNEVLTDQGRYLRILQDVQILQDQKAKGHLY